MEWWSCDTASSEPEPTPPGRPYQFLAHADVLPGIGRDVQAQSSSEGSTRLPNCRNSLSATARSGERMAPSWAAPRRLAGLPPDAAQLGARRCLTRCPSSAGRARARRSCTRSATSIWAGRSGLTGSMVESSLRRYLFKYLWSPASRRSRRGAASYEIQCAQTRGIALAGRTLFFLTP